MIQDKDQQKKFIIEIMEADEKDGLYNSGISKMETTQTAVEWLDENLDNLLPFINQEIADEYLKLIKQAKQMERSEIEIAYETGWVNGDLKKYPRYGKDYYNDNLK